MTARCTNCRSRARNVAIGVDNASVATIRLLRLRRRQHPAATPTSPARPTPARPHQPVVARADSRAHRPTRPPTLALRTRLPSRATARADVDPNGPESGRVAARTRSIATAVCDPLCGSIPITTPICSSLAIARDVRVRAGTPDSGGSCSRTSFEPRPGTIPAGRKLDRKPVGSLRRQAVREPHPPGPPTLRNPQRQHHELNQAVRCVVQVSNETVASLVMTGECLGGPCFQARGSAARSEGRSRSSRTRATTD